MFKKLFIDLCNKKGEAPSSVCRKVGITPATFSGWTEKTIPRQATLYRIADYFGVTVDYLLAQEKEPPGLTPEGEDEIDAQILTIFSRLPDDKKREAKTYLEFLDQQGRKDN